MDSLPKLMVAPNGARKQKLDHPELPVTIKETVATAIACHAAGADGLHLHVRDAEGGHTLDSSLYKDAINELEAVVPTLRIQITTEAVGQYCAKQQRQVVRDVRPQEVSISLNEMVSEDDRANALEFYRWCHSESIAVQHILYGQHDLDLLGRLLHSADIDADNLQLLFVLGRYTSGQQSSPDDLDIFLHWMSSNGVTADWALCAFGKNETACLQKGLSNGGKLRVGFENSVWNADGSVARDNAERVAEVRALFD